MSRNYRLIVRNTSYLKGQRSNTCIRRPWLHIITQSLPADSKRRPSGRRTLRAPGPRLGRNRLPLTGSHTAVGRPQPGSRADGSETHTAGQESDRMHTHTQLHFLQEQKPKRHLVRLQGEGFGEAEDGPLIPAPSHCLASIGATAETHRCCCLYLG